MDFLPVFFSIVERDCLVVGGGTVAHRKVKHLLRSGARVTVAAPSLVPELREMAAAGRISHIERLFEPTMVEGRTLIVSATEKKAVNREVAAAAEAHNIPINVVDDLELSRFIFPATVDRSPIVIAVSSGGNSPVLARLLKARLESLVPMAYGRLGELAGAFRQRVKDLFPEMEQRRKFWERHFQGETARLFLSGREKEARESLEAALITDRGQGATPGSVSFLTVDTEDPELLTLKGLRCLQEADTIVYDPSVPGEILDMARKDADRLIVGDQAGVASCPPGELPLLLVRLAKEGRHVVRLRGRARTLGTEEGARRPGETPEDEECAALGEQGIHCRML